MSKNIIVSFIVPIFNTPAELLERSIDSIVANLQEGYEILLINDGSTNPDTNKKCEELCRLQNIFYFEQQNKGVSVARNKGIEQSCGKYIIFIDPDDYVTEEMGDILNKLNACSFDVIAFDYIRETNTKQRTRIGINVDLEFLDKQELINNALFCGTLYPDYYAGAIWAKAFKSSFIRNNNLKFDPVLRKAQDRIFMLYVYNLADSIYYNRSTSYVYYQNFESICNKYNKNASVRSHAFVNAVSTFLDKTNIKLDAKRLLASVNYISFFEVLYLDLFNFENLDDLKTNLGKAEDEYQYFNIEDATRVLRLGDFKSMSEKIKFILIKIRAFRILNYLISVRQKKARYI